MPVAWLLCGRVSWPLRYRRCVLLMCGCYGVAAAAPATQLVAADLVGVDHREFRRLCKEDKPRARRIADQVATVLHTLAGTMRVTAFSPASALGHTPSPCCRGSGTMRPTC